MLAINHSYRKEIEFVKLFQDKADWRVLYFSSTTYPEILELIKIYSGDFCEKPDLSKIVELSHEPPFTMKLF